MTVLPGGNLASVVLPFSSRNVVSEAPEDRQCALRWKRGMAGTRRVEHAAETEQVGAVVHHFAAGLLGGHVERRAEDGVEPAQARVVLGRAGEAEVQQLDAAA